MTKDFKCDPIDILADEPALWAVKKGGRKVRHSFPPTPEEPLNLDGPLDILLNEPLFVDALEVTTTASPAPASLEVEVYGFDTNQKTLALAPSTASTIEIGRFAYRVRLTPASEPIVIQQMALCTLTFEKLDESWNSAIKALEARQKELAALEERKGKTVTEVETLKAEVGMLHGQVTELEAECGGLTEKKALLREEEGKYRSRIGELKEEKAKWIKSVEDERGKVAQIVEEQGEASEKLKALAKEVGIRESTLSETQKRLDFYQDDIYGLTSYFKSGARKTYIIAAIGGASMIGAGGFGLWLCFERWRGIASLQPKPAIDLYLLLSQAPIVAIAGFLVAGAYYVSVAALRNRFRQEAEYERIVAVEFLVRNAGKAVSDKLDEPGKLEVHKQQVELLKGAFEKILQPWEDPWTKKPNVEAALKEITRDHGLLDVFAEILSMKIGKKGASE